MTAEQPTARDIFEAILEAKSPPEQAALLDRLCANEAELRARVEALLRAHRAAHAFLEASPVSATLELHASQMHAGPGSMIGPYRLMEQIGEGGFGHVFVAEQHQPLRRRVALKVIKPGMDSREVISRFEAERQALAMMEHPNIARVLDAGTTSAGRPYFVMELVHGIPITEYCDQNSLTPRERIELFVPVCHAIQHAHQKGIVHRDVKPTNVLVTTHDGRPVPKIIDFGVAKALHQPLTDATIYTRFHQMIGTPLYMSPEQAEMTSSDIDTRSDIYSLGVLLYELITGTTPFDRKRFTQAAFDEIRRIIRDEDPPKPSTRLTQSGDRLASIAAQRRTEPARLSRLIQGDLDWIVMKALEKDRTRRYATADNLAKDIERFLHDEPVEAGPPSRIYRMRKFARRNRKALLSGAMLLAFLLVGTSVSIWQAIRASRAESAAIRERDEKEIARQEAVINADKALAAADAERQARAAEAEQRRQALNEAAIARSINDFLNKELLGQANVENQIGPIIPVDPNISVRLVLERAATRLLGRFPDQPLVEAALHATIGKTYLNLEWYDRAELHLRRALELRRAISGSDEPATLDSRKDYALLLLMQEKVDESIAELRGTLEIAERALGTSHLTTLEIREQLAFALNRNGMNAEALELAQANLKARIEQLESEPLDTLRNRGLVALILANQGDFNASNSHLRELLESCRSRLGPDHPQTLGAMQMLGWNYLIQSNLAEAEPLVMEAYTRAQKLYDADKLVITYYLHSVALLREKRNQLDEADKLYRQIIQIRQSFLGDSNHDTINAKNNLCQFLTQNGRAAEAEPICQEILDSGSDPDSSGVRWAKRNLADSFRVQGKLDKAAEQYEEYLESRTANSQDVVPVEFTHQDLADVYRRLGKFAEREALAKSVLDEQESEPDSESESTAFWLGVVGDSQLRREHFAEAELTFRRCVEMDQLNPRLSLLVAINTCRLAVAIAHQAAAIADQNAEEAEARFLEAQGLLISGEQQLPKQAATLSQSVRKRYLSEAYQLATEFYVLWKKPDEAATWQAKFEAAQSAPTIDSADK